jgi:molecular chaperone HscB
MVDPFDTLGIAPSFELDLEKVEQRYRELSRVLHPDRNVGRPPAERRLSLGKAVEVNEAWRTLRDPIRRAEALFRRGNVAVEEGRQPKADPEFLMEMMEQREALAAAKASGDRTSVERLAATIRRREEAATAKLAAGFRGAFGQVVEAPRLEPLLPLLGELRYYRRFLDEVSAIDDELALSSAGGTTGP